MYSLFPGGSRYVAPDTNNLSFSWVDNGGPTATSIEPTLGSVGKNDFDKSDQQETLMPRNS